MFEEVKQIGLELIAEEEPRDTLFEHEYYAFDMNSSIDGRHGQFITLKISTWSYMGGAHGNGYSAYHIFDCQKDSVINIYDFLIREDELIDRVKAKLLEQIGAEPGTSLAEMGFDRISLPSNISIQQDQMVFHYNVYEIAPYSMGAPSVSFPISEMRRYFLMDL
ncbi:MAG: DUF3298 domain-containing protein [Flavobacteriales bacterium]|nr:DUF3298 domain-containing protein [Flavobacteriales bacterium]